MWSIGVADKIARFHRFVALIVKKPDEDNFLPIDRT